MKHGEMTNAGDEFNRDPMYYCAKCDASHTRGHRLCSAFRQADYQNDHPERYVPTGFVPRAGVPAHVDVDRVDLERPPSCPGCGVPNGALHRAGCLQKVVDDQLLMERKARAWDALMAKTGAAARIDAATANGAVFAIDSTLVERALNAHRTTVARWLAGTTALPGAQHLAVRQLLGHLPGTDGCWQGWRFQGGLLHSPANETYTPGDVLGIRLQQQRVSALDRELRDLRARLKVLEKTVDLYGPAANQEQARA